MKQKLTIFALFLSTWMMGQSKSFNPFIKNHKPLNQRYSDLNLKVEKQSAYLKYDFLKSTKRNQFRLDADLQPIPQLFSSNRNKSENNPLKYSEINLQLSNQFYINNNFYINAEVGYSGLAGHGGSHSYRQYSGFGGIGYGRVYQIDRATSVAFMIEKLKKEGLLTDDLTYEEKEALIKVIDDGKNVKELSNRTNFSKIYFALVNQLKPKLSKEIGEEELFHVIKKSMRSDYLSLQRQKGFKIGLDYGGHISNFNSSIYTYAAHLKGLHLKAAYYKPLGLHWQLDQTITASYGEAYLETDALNNDNFDQNYKDKTFNLGYDLGLTNYINNRSSVFFNGNINYNSRANRLNYNLKLGMNYAVTKNIVISPFIQVGSISTNIGTIHATENLKLGMNLNF